VCLKSSVNGIRKQKKTEVTNKLTLLAFKIIVILHNTLLVTFIKLLEIVSKGLCRNRSQNRCHTFLDCRHVCKPCAFHNALQAGKQKEVRRCQIRGVRWMIENGYAALSQELVDTDRSNIHCPVLCNPGRTWWMRRSNRFKTSS